MILIALPILPESPRWLVQHDRVDEATRVLARFEGTGIGPDHHHVVRQSEEMIDSVKQEAVLGQASWGEVFTEGRNRNISRVLLGTGPYM